MKIAIEGCGHGKLDKIYESIHHLEQVNNIKVDVLIICGDFEALRNTADLSSMACPEQYRFMESFHKYYSGESKAPVLTIFIGGNHEASNYLAELPYGGWVAPNIYFMGYASVVTLANIRIAGISGIYNYRDYNKGRYELFPYNKETSRTCYHTRSIDVFRLKQLSKPVDVFLSHDWPLGVYKHGNVDELLRVKTYFKNDIEKDCLGSAPLWEILNEIQPSYWFAAHLHVKFAAIIKHNDNASTRFLALDKCLPRRSFLQVLDIPHEGEIELKYDLEWLTILRLTNHLTSVSRSSCYMPGPGCDERWKFTPTDNEKDDVFTKMSENLTIPLNFVQTAPTYDPDIHPSQISMQLAPNPQTTELCNRLGIDDVYAMLLEKSDISINSSLSNNSHNDSTSFIDSEADISASPLKNARTPMKLPPPSIAEELVPIMPNPISCSTPVSTDLTRKELSCDEDTNPSVPKFKRRNVIIYSSRDDNE